MSNIYDGITYNGEKEILEIRLNELKDVVFKTIIVESNRTQVGKPKPYKFEAQKDYFADFLDNIVYVKLDDSHLDNNPIQSGDWRHEHYVREAIKDKGLLAVQKSGIKLYQDDYLVISDVDEIPKALVINDLCNKQRVDIISLNHYFNSYFLNWYSDFRSWGWYGSVICKMVAFNDNRITLKWLRDNKDHLMHTGNEGEGYHFSNLLVNGFDTVYNKIIDNIEPHNKLAALGKGKDAIKQEFEKCVFGDKCFFFTDNWNDRSIKFKNLSIDKLPAYVQNNIGKYKNLIRE
jgi:hypothetical protein